MSAGCEPDGPGPESVDRRPFGEIGLINRVPRTATVSAAVRSVLLRIDGDEFVNSLVTATALSELLDVVNRRLSRTSRERSATPVE